MLLPSLLTLLLLATTAVLLLRSLRSTADVPAARITPLAALPGAELHPAFSPDGEYVAFALSSETNVNEGFDIHVYSVDGATGRKLTDDPRNELEPAWSPDGQEIAFLRDAGSRWDLWTVPAAGGKERRLGSASSHRGLAYSSAFRDLNMWRIDGPSARAPSGEATRIAPSTRWEFQPDYANDGDKIVFVSDRSGSPEIWVAPSNGGSRAQLTSLENSNGYRLNPRWSPDGERIAFQSPHLGDWDIYSIRRHGGTVRHLVRGKSEEVYPSWSRDLIVENFR